MRVEQLEPRDVPATDVGLGTVYLAPGVYRHAFEDSWTGHLNLHDTGEKVYVGAGQGGGPRVQVYDRAGNLLEDFFAGDPASRAGVYFVPTDPAVREVPVEVRVPTPYPVPAEVPAISVGDLASPDPFVVYVDWERPPSLAWVQKGMAQLGSLAAGVPDLVLTTVRPEAYPWKYGAAVVGPDLDFADAPGVEIGGLGFANWTDGYTVQGTEYVQAGYEHSTEDQIGALVWHEVAHGFGWRHGDDGTPDDPEDYAVVAHGVQLAKNF